MIKLSIVILNYNTPELVYNCLKSIDGKLNCSFEIIIVDNGSESKVVEAELKKILPNNNVKLLILEKNLGFGSGNNAGVEAASGEILWLLNSDTLVPDESINRAIEFLDQHSEIGVLSPLLYNDPEGKQFQADMYANFQTVATLISRKARNELKNDQDFFETDVVVGGSMLMKKELFNKVGGFDQKIFMFMEDDDLCYRIKKMRYKIGIFNQAKIIHLQGKSISKNTNRKKMYYNSQNYFWQKNYGFWPALIMRLIRLPYKILKTH